MKFLNYVMVLFTGLSHQYQGELTQVTDLVLRVFATTSLIL